MESNKVHCERPAAVAAVRTEACYPLYFACLQETLILIVMVAVKRVQPALLKQQLILAPARWHENKFERTANVSNT
jgi:hypothetical protein